MALAWCGTISRTGRKTKTATGRCKTPVVMISGFTHPLNEFTTPYRVINYHTCNSCWNDPHHRFDHKDFLWCPRHKDTPRQFECTRLITVEQVKAMIQRVLLTSNAGYPR